MLYWEGYCEKASSKYSTYRDKQYFATDAGSNNYTYPGYVCGVNGQPWCAATVSNAIKEACNGYADAREVMWGLWPYVACNQLYDAAPSTHKGRRGAWTPKPGDIIVFQQNGARVHTGMVYAVNSTYVYTIEGNSANKCQKRSYLLTSTYIYGYVRPDYAEGGETEETEVAQYGAAISGINLHVLSKGTAGDEVKTIQRICKTTVDSSLTVDGDFGTKTKAAVILLQKRLGLTQDGIVGKNTWAKALKELA